MSKKLLAVSMVAFIGTKSVLATPMSRAEYCEYRGWQVPENEDPNEPVYLVEYTDGGKPNDERHKGYITMSPKEVFDNAYRQNGLLTFGDAVVALKQGQKVARSGWNGKGMFLALVKGSDADYHVNSRVFGTGMDGNSEKQMPILDAIYMKTADNKLVPWLASQTDVLAEDWVIL
ncbi:DUF2829 domain-containing protein [Acinetobacter rudis]|uniref:DUF2829 domain-containing protein n=1 Tax=Acinetobacter rudis TaxID=632955 RepID=UPI00280CF677|nr:DUF2829 domain-containing protein [Acinetobacter rudis]MDQ8953491.1 DUF2829 domain-containing protein [Acinetobacter rudis]